MKKLKKAYESKGHTGRSFAKSVGLTPPVLSNINKGIVNPTPPTLKKMTAELSCATDDIITPQEFNYGLGPGSKTSKAIKSDIRENSDRADVRGPMVGIREFKAFCVEHGLTMWGFIKMAMPLVADALKVRRAA